jgi:hypothetical protein
MTPTEMEVFNIRIYWDDKKNLIEAGWNFFGMGMNQYAHLNSLSVTVNQEVIL